MFKLNKYFLLLLTTISSVIHAQVKDSNAYALMSALDLQTTGTSNITLINATNESITASGLFIASFDINDCSACLGSVVGGDNLGGAMISTLTFRPGQSLSIGQNYLYNMLYNGIYYIKNSLGSSPCSLPGCSWPGDDPTVQGWCISINVISSNSSYTYSNYVNGTNPPSNVPAYSAAGNSVPFDYKYDLINPATLGTGNACLGLITCNDQTLTCKVATPQNETIQVYN